MDVIRKIIRKILLCWMLGLHDWTSKASEGIPPDESEKGSELGFWLYAKMYCKKCGKVSPLSKKQIDRVKMELAQKEKEEFIKKLLGNVRS